MQCALNEFIGAAVNWTALHPQEIYTNDTPIEQKGVHTRVTIQTNKTKDLTRNESSWARAEDGFYHPSQGFPTGGRVTKSTLCQERLIKTYAYARETFGIPVSTFRANTGLEKITMK